MTKAMMSSMSSVMSPTPSSFIKMVSPTNTLPSIVVLPTTSISMGSNSASPMPTATLMMSMDAKCGPGTGKTCMGSEFGPCCSSQGWCGNTTDYCAVTKCQTGFGTCWTAGPGAVGMDVVEGSAAY